MPSFKKPFLFARICWRKSRKCFKKLRKYTMGRSNRLIRRVTSWDGNNQQWTTTQDDKKKWSEENVGW
jgi:hypothetical protein